MAMKPDEQPAITQAEANGINMALKPDQEADEMREDADEMRDEPNPNEMVISGKLNKCDYPELEKIDEATIETIYEKCTDLNIIVAGVTGSGKSSLANAIVGAEMFKEGTNLHRCTEHVAPRRSKNVHFLRVWDSPGLFDGTNQDKKYLKEIRCVLKKFQPGDLMVFCIEAKARFNKSGKNNKELEVLLKMKKKFGNEFFKSMVIALTFVDTIVSRTKRAKRREHYETTIRQYETDIREALERYVKVERDLAQRIPIFPVQHQENVGDTLPDGARWLSAFWFGCLDAIPDIIGQAKWLKYFEQRIVDEPDPDPEIARRQLVLLDDFLPEELLEIRRKYKKRGIALAVILGGPLMLLTIPMGIWAGRKYGEKQYLEEKSKKKTEKQPEDEHQM